MSHLTQTTNYHRTHANCGGIVDPLWPSVTIAIGDNLSCRDCRREDVQFIETVITPICAEFAEYGTCIHSDHTL